MMKTNKLKPLMGALMLGATLTPLIASDDDVTELDAVTVTAVKTEAQKNLEVLTAEKMEPFQPGDLEDAFALIPSTIVGGSHPSSQKIYVRGFEDKLLNISVDGATQAGYLSHHQSQFKIDPELLKSIDVSTGAGRATDGFGALAGAIAFEHKGAEDFLEDGQQYGAFLKTSYGDVNESKRGSLTLFGQPNEGFSYLANFSYLDAEDFEDGQGTVREYTAHEQTRGYLKMEAALDERQDVTASFEKVTDEGTYRHRPNFYGFFNHPVAPNNPVEMETSRTTFTTKYDLDGGADWLNLSASAFYTEYLIERSGQYDLGYGSVGAKLENVTEWNDHTFTYGFEYRRDDVEMDGTGSVTGFAITLTYPDFEEDVDIYGFYLQDDYRLSDDITLSYGARFDNYDYKDRSGRSFDESGFSPNATIIFYPTDEIELHAGVAKSFRGVTPLDSLVSAEGGTVNSADIDPEEATNIEVGLAYDNGDFFANALVFKQEIEDVIYATNRVRDNGGDLESQGYEANIGYRYNKLVATLGVAFADPELNGEPLADSNLGLGTAYGRMWTGSLTYDLSEHDVQLGWLTQLVEDFDDVPATFPTKDGYAVHSIYAVWQPLENDKLTLNLTVDNLFDKFYYDQTTNGYNAALARVVGMPEPGRDIRVSVSYQF